MKGLVRDHNEGIGTIPHSFWYHVSASQPSIAFARSHSWSLGGYEMDFVALIFLLSEGSHVLIIFFTHLCFSRSLTGALSGGSLLPVLILFENRMLRKGAYG